MGGRHRRLAGAGRKDGVSQVSRKSHTASLLGASHFLISSGIPDLEPTQEMLSRWKSLGRAHPLVAWAHHLNSYGLASTCLIGSVFCDRITEQVSHLGFVTSHVHLSVSSLLSGLWGNVAMPLILLPYLSSLRNPSLVRAPAFSVPLLQYRKF